jgi:hypothetical protein
MRALWLGLAPWLGSVAADLGLPVAVRIELPGDGASAELRLIDQDLIDLQPEDFVIPAGFQL